MKGEGLGLGLGVRLRLRVPVSRGQLKPVTAGYEV